MEIITEYSIGKIVGTTVAARRLPPLPSDCERCVICCSVICCNLWGNCGEFSGDEANHFDGWVVAGAIRWMVRRAEFEVDSGEREVGLARGWRGVSEVEDRRDDCR